MPKHRKQKPAGTARPDTESPASKMAKPLSRAKVWTFRLLSLVLAPLVFLGGIELVLRTAGYGYSTDFLRPLDDKGQKSFVSNNQFGWRFFGKELARWPCAFSIAQTKATNSVRIFVLGESAARGEPQPDFGLPRVLEALFNLRYPGVKFEVVNTAMTAINSHAILPIARDCARANGDIWVIYMGNNEVVGSFGAGTVFGPQIPPLPLIRASLAVKATRAGQLLDSGLGQLRPAPAEDTVWGGMAMFLSQQVRADDLRMERVYHHFERNLSDIIRAGHRSGAGIVVSTVAVNLKDCAPFASAHRSSLSDADKTKWAQDYQRGSSALESGNWQEAAGHFRAAATLDNTHAELRFRQGECSLVLGEAAEARAHFLAARDLDTLRFRCDTRLNELIRQSAKNRESEKIVLADAERAFANQATNGLPGEEFFYEHVHLTPAGNYLLARTIADQVERLLPESLVGHDTITRPWPSSDDCARSLGYSSWHDMTALNSIIATLSDPPFTGQVNHQAQKRKWELALATLAPTMTPAGIHHAVEVCESASQTRPDDPVLHRQLASLKKAAGDIAGAAAAARGAVELLPNDSEGWALLGALIAQQGELDDATLAFERAFQLGPQGIKSRLDLAGALAAMGKHDQAIQAYRAILAQKPRCVPALLQLGQVEEKLGRKTEADAAFRQAFTNRSQRLPELVELAAFLSSRGSFEMAAEIYRDAIKLNPTAGTLQLSAGRNFASLGRYDEATHHTAEAVRLSPESVEAHLLHGIVLHKRGRTAQAMEQFHEALRIQPESVDARLNLGLALVQSGNNAEALRWFGEALERSPTNQLALKYVRSLRSNASPP